MNSTRQSISYIVTTDANAGSRRILYRTFLAETLQNPTDDERYCQKFKISAIPRDRSEDDRRKSTRRTARATDRRVDAGSFVPLSAF